MKRDDLERVLSNTADLQAAAARLEELFAELSDQEIRGAMARFFKHRTGMTEALADVVKRWKALEAAGAAPEVHEDRAGLEGQPPAGPETKA